MKNPNNQCSMECNVHVRVLGTDGSIKTDKLFKNTATKRMTDGIALFLAGDGAVEHRGAWRPNYISFGTTGIVRQPIKDDGVAILADDFEDRNPPEGQRTRPWFYSTWLGERVPANQHGEGKTPEENGCWDHEYGWGVPDVPSAQRTFQGELVSYVDDIDGIPVDSWGQPLEYDILRRHPLLRAEVSMDFPAERELDPQGYASDCIFYGYSSVKWCRYFFQPPAPGESPIPRLAISEFGLFERDSFPKAGLKTMMAGFRVPTADDIVYVEPDEVMLVEWRITIRALMPYEGVAPTKLDPGIVPPTGVSIDAALSPSRENAVDFEALVLGDGVRQFVDWRLDQASPSTELIIAGHNRATLVIGESESSPIIYVTATCRDDINIHSKTAIITGMVGNIATGVAVSLTHSSTIDREYGFLATVLGKGEHYPTDVEWTLTSDTAMDPGTELVPDPEDPENNNKKVLRISPNETANQLRLVASSVADSEIRSIAVVIQVDVTRGSYVVTDFSILTD